MCESDNRFDRLYYKLSVLGNFSGFLVMSYFYSLHGQDFLHTPYVCLFSVILYCVYAIYAVMCNQGFLRYNIDRVKNERSIGSLLMASFYAILVIIEFLIPADAVVIIQKGLFITAFLIPIYGIITIK